MEGKELICSSFFFSCSIQLVTVSWVEFDEKNFGGKWLNFATREGWLKSEALTAFSSSTCTRQQHHTYLLYFFSLSPHSHPLHATSQIMYIHLYVYLNQNKAETRKAWQPYSISLKSQRCQPNIPPKHNMSQTIV